MVAVASRRIDETTRVAHDIAAKHGTKTLGLGCDVRVRASVDEAVAATVRAFGGLDILVNNAGLGVSAKIADCTDEEWDLVLDTNLKGTFFVTRAALPHLKKAGKGYVLNIASQAALHGYDGAGPYCASKFGVVGFGKALQKEVAADGIRVHSLCPALVQVPAPASPAERRDDVLQAEDLAEAALFVLTQPARVKIQDLGLHHAGWSPD